jgi:hypothetical protein
MMKLRAIMRCAFLTKTEEARKSGSLRKRKPRSTPPWSDVSTNESFVGEGRRLQEIGADNPARFAKDFLHDLEVVEAHTDHQLPQIACRASIGKLTEGWTYFALKDGTLH